MAAVKSQGISSKMKRENFPLAAGIGYDSRGFAILTVLFALVVIAGLAAIATSQIAVFAKARSLQTAAQNEASFGRSLTHFGPSYARVIRDASGPSLIEDEEVRIGSNPLKISVYDVGGLIDVNTARMDLLEAFLASEFTDPVPIMTSIRSLRDDGVKLPSVQAFAALDAFENRLDGDALSLLTTLSGREGVSPSRAPTALLLRLSKREGERRGLETAFPTEWRSPPTNRTYRVLGANDQGKTIGQSVFSLGANDDEAATVIYASR